MFCSVLEGRELAFILAQAPLSCQIDKKDKKAQGLAGLSDFMPNIEKIPLTSLDRGKCDLFSGPLKKANIDCEEKARGIKPGKILGAVILPDVIAWH